jgi:hypothetical protein
MDATEITNVTGITFTNTETGEEFELRAADDDQALTNEVILAWDGQGIWRFEP